MVYRRILASLAALAAGACADNPAFKANDSATSEPIATVTTPTDPTTGTPTATSTIEPDLSSGTGPAGTTTTLSTDPTTTGISLTTEAVDDASTTTGDATTGELVGPHTCREALDAGMTESGLVKLAAPNLPAGSVSVWCEQKLLNGGWMLVGRSAKNGKATAFGWNHDLGDPMKFDMPYSLDAVSLGLPMTQILVAIHDSGNVPVKAAYALAVPADFLTAYPDSSAPVTAIDTTLGECKPSGGPRMLLRAGYTDLKDRFRLRDLEDDMNDFFGLRVDGFNLYYNDCPFGADLNQAQGIMFVRS